MKNLILTLSLLISISGYAQNKPAPVVGPTLNVIEVVDFQKVKKSDKPASKVVKIKNTGTQPLLITACTPSCGCTAPLCPREPILPGKTADMTVEYKNTHIIGQFSKTVTIMSNDSSAPAKTITIKGEITE